MASHGIQIAVAALGYQADGVPRNRDKTMTVMTSDNDVDNDDGNDHNER